ARSGAKPARRATHHVSWPIRQTAMTVLLVAMLAACSGSPNPVLYTIEPIAGTPHRGGPRVVLLQQVGVPRLLERSQIVRSSESYRLDVLANDWWGEPLGAMLDRILAEELGQRLPGSVVLNESSAISASPDAILEVAIQRLDQDHAGSNVILQAQTRLETRRRGGSVLRSIRIVEPVTSPGTAGQVQATSVAIGHLADELAKMLAAR
ncbi:MAG: membrane integrity-associated transporter subunit PqiC, partial [Acetobacteraceae bacterium]